LLAGVLALVGMFGLGASPASAILVKLPSGKYASYESLAGAKTPQAARNFDAAFTNLDYRGGPVMPSNTNYVVVWNPSNYSGTPFQSKGTYSKDYLSGINQFFTDMATDSGHSTNSDAVSTQYNDSSGNTAAYNFQSGGSLTDTDPLPANGCPAFSGDICISDAQIQAELDHFLSSQHLPADLSHEYYLVTPPDVASCFDSGGSECSANADLNQAFCAYHGQTAGSYVYSNIPDLSGVYGCDPFVTFCPNFNCFYNNGPADGVLSAISHEHNESTTDPQPNNAWTDWGSNVGGEIGDKCNNDGMDDPNLVPQNDGFGDDTPYNETIGGDHYLIQREWSNQSKSCRDSFTANSTTVNASFAQSAGSGTTVNFNAGGSTGNHGIAEYVWQFNDGPGQTTTVERTTPTISHTFATPGTYRVALTVMASDGTSNGAAHDVAVTPLSRPTASFTFSQPSQVEGTLVSFDASGSSDPNPGGFITSYNWSFGDGGSSGGKSPSHVYANAGTYTATLTVTDNYGQTSTSASHTVSVVDEQPSVSFNPPTGGTAGSPVSFTGSGFDPDGSIVAYSWNFGDGSLGSGASTSHTYSAPGTYTVTLTGTDSSGQTGTTSHQVTIGNQVVIVPVRCVVPNVKGKSLRQAQTALGRAHCSLGKVKRPRHKPRRSAGKHKKWALVVGSESPGAGRVEPNGTRVNLSLVYKAVHK
jgi:PKD repeat protein